MKLTDLDVIKTLEEIAKERGLPERIKSDNGTGSTSLVYDKWAYEKEITTDYSRRGKSTDDTCEKIESWRQDYNQFRPHSSLDDQSAYEFNAAQKGEKILLFAVPIFG